MNEWCPFKSHSYEEPPVSLNRFNLSFPLFFFAVLSLYNSTYHFLVYSGVICLCVWLPPWTVTLKDQGLYFIHHSVPIMSLIHCLVHSRCSGGVGRTETLSLSSSLKWGTGCLPCGLVVEKLSAKMTGTAKGLPRHWVLWSHRVFLGCHAGKAERQKLLFPSSLAKAWLIS